MWSSCEQAYWGRMEQNSRPTPLELPPKGSGTMSPSKSYSCWAMRKHCATIVRVGLTANAPGMIEASFTRRPACTPELPEAVLNTWPDGIEGVGHRLPSHCFVEWCQSRG